MVFHVKKARNDFEPDARVENVAWLMAQPGRIGSWPWHGKNGKRPSVEFKLLWSEERIYVRFHVLEEFVLGKRTEFQSSVCRDSCVEFFVSPNDRGYFNFEISCIGTLLLMYGKERSKRLNVPWDDAGRISISTSLPKGRAISYPQECPKEGYVVEYAIPFSIFGRYSRNTGPKPGDIWKANFYKCADDLPQPHWGSWSPVKTVKPDFHRPEYFGKIVFEP